MLALYLNVAAYGNQVVGAERASRAVFRRSASMLTPAQAAFLAGLPQRPSGFNPYRSRAAALARQQVVLRRMTAAGALTAEQAREAGAERLEFTRASARFSAPHFVEMALAAAGDERPPVIETTLDAGLQADVTGIIESHREMLKKHGASNVAVVVLDNATGEWRAWEGSGDYFDAQHGGAINGPLMPRQPGSALKPFTYALGFENGFSPATVLPDVPSHFPTASPAFSTVPGTTTAGIAARCSSGAPWQDPRTCPPWRSPPSSACRTCSGSWCAPGSRHSIATRRTTGSA